jgi:hypothetical protein
MEPSPLQQEMMLQECARNQHMPRVEVSGVRPGARNVNEQLSELDLNCEALGSSAACQSAQVANSYEEGGQTVDAELLGLFLKVTLHPHAAAAAACVEHVQAGSAHTGVP